MCVHETNLKKSHLSAKNIIVKMTTQHQSSLKVSLCSPPCVKSTTTTTLSKPLVHLTSTSTSKKLNTSSSSTVNVDHPTTFCCTLEIKFIW